MSTPDHVEPAPQSQPRPASIRRERASPTPPRPLLLIAWLLGAAAGAVATIAWTKLLRMNTSPAFVQLLAVAAVSNLLIVALLGARWTRDVGCTRAGPTRSVQEGSGLDPLGRTSTMRG